MTVLEWDKVGERFYQSGIDRGVLGLNDGSVVAWNGLVSMDEGDNSELKSYYLDGIKILDHVTPGEFVGNLSAITYPDEFDQVLGIDSISGLSFYEQRPKSFNLAYRTKIGNDLDENYGYKLHLLYNLKAIANSKKFDTMSNDGNLSEFSWSLTGTPVYMVGRRATCHIVIDSSDTEPEVLQAIEDILYGTDLVEPRFPTLIEIRVLFEDVGALVITDNGDGTWTADDASDDYITMLDSETFQIDHANATYLDPERTTYQISDTEIPLP